MKCEECGSEDLIVELDKTQAYPSQDIEITIYYRTTFPETEEYDFHEDQINMVVTSSGLVEDIETTDYLLTHLVGTAITSGVKYPAAKVNIHIPNDHGDNGILEKSYDVYISNLADYCNVVTLKVLSVEEALIIELEDTKASQGDSVTTIVKYKLLVPSDVSLTRPLNSLEIKLDDISFTPTLSFPGEVVGGQEITLTTYNMIIPEDAESKNFTAKAIGSPPLLESNHLTLNINETQRPVLTVVIVSREPVKPGEVVIIGGSVTAMVEGEKVFIKEGTMEFETNIPGVNPMNDVLDSDGYYRFGFTVPE